MRRKRIAYYAEAWGQGGIERSILNTVSRLDREAFEFDIFTVHTWYPAYDEEIEKFGGTRSTLFDGFQPSLPKRSVEGLRAWDAFLVRGGYDIAHINGMNGLAFAYARVAQRRGVPVRIVHSHNTSFGGGSALIKRLVHEAGKTLFSSSANVLFACSEEAGGYLFGRRSFTVVRNGVDTSRFRYSAESRQQVRDAFGIGGRELVFGNVGRLAEAKNPLFLLEVLDAMRSQGVSARLMLVGDGPMKREVVACAEALGLSEYVVLPGGTGEPEAFLSALDVFALPSLFEGAPMAVCEAISCGLPVVLSKFQPPVPVKDALGVQLPIDDVAAWRDEIIDFASAGINGANRAEAYRMLESCGLDLDGSLRDVFSAYEQGSGGEGASR